MPVTRLMKRPIFWGGMAVAVLMLDEAGRLDDLLRAVGVKDAQAASAHGDAAAQVAAAERTAARHLPRFAAEALRQPESWDLRAVKVRFPGADPAADVWVEAFDFIGSDWMRGQPSQTGQTGSPSGPIQFHLDHVVDWAFVQEGRGYGYFTVHAGLGQMSPAQAAVTRSFLADQPLPPGW